MRLATFLEIVEENAGITPEEAARAAHATLRTLAERITRGEAEHIASFLPRELREPLTSAPEHAERFGLDEFVRRVAEREDVDEATARRHVRAVFMALGQAVAPDELRDMASQLPLDFDPLLKAAHMARGEVRVSAEDPVVLRVAELASLDPPEARRAVEAVLEALAVRISAGEVEDLIRRLPADLVPALERGLVASRSARKMSLYEFLELVADREGVEHDEAARHARAVFAALREFVPHKEMDDVATQLPDDYAPLLSGIV